ncbi:MarR family winged helix-turn-helix transcriptional regulator [Streptomyces sp. NPDC050560]|uniref:MarR family winged helix-turn-helix transcriptional regulator n=1 Tax=Streptomyces sp. NPDC050560 TaxID=3365630 RepID=UPI0037916F24
MTTAATATAEGDAPRAERAETRDGAAGGRAGHVAAIERQTAVLNRNFELLYRRSDVHEELDRAEYLLLSTLADHGPMDINSLASTLGLDPSTAGRQVAAMRRRGLVEREADPADRRRGIVTPRPEGLARAGLVRERRTESFAELLADWDAEDLATLGAMFEKYNETVARHYLA